MQNVHSMTQNQKAKGEETDNGYDFQHWVVFVDSYLLQQQKKISIHIFCLLKPILQETIFKKNWLFF